MRTRRAPGAKRLLAVFAGMLLVGTLGAGPAFAQDGTTDTTPTVDTNLPVDTDTTDTTPTVDTDLPVDTDTTDTDTDLPVDTDTTDTDTTDTDTTDTDTTDTDTDTTPSTACTTLTTQFNNLLAQRTALINLINASPLNTILRGQLTDLDAQITSVRDQLEDALCSAIPGLPTTQPVSGATNGSCPVGTTTVTSGGTDANGNPLSSIPFLGTVFTGFFSGIPVFGTVFSGTNGATCVANNTGAYNPYVDGYADGYKDGLANGVTPATATQVASVPTGGVATGDGSF